MILNKQVLAILLILIVLGITPASASTISDIQKEGDYVDKYTHEGGWYKFSHFFDFCESIFKIVSLINSEGSEMESSSKQAEEQKIEAENSNIELQNKKDTLKILSEYYGVNSLKNEFKNKSKSNNTSNTNKNQSSKGNNNNQTNTNKSSTNNTDNSKLIKNNTDNSHDNNQTNKNKTSLKTPKKLLLNDAYKVKNDIKKLGIKVEVKNVSRADLQSKSIVQLLNNNGYIKYMVYFGTKTVDNETYVKLFNGQEDSLVLFNKFKKSYTGLILQFNGSSNDEIQTVCGVVQKIYEDKLVSLDSDINFHNKSLIAANVIKGIGIAVSILIMILTCVASILMLAPEPGMSKVTAILLYKWAIAGVAVATTLYLSGLAIESVSTVYKNEYVAEKTDLENFKL